MRPPGFRNAVVAAACGLAVTGAAGAAEVSRPADCLPDRVVAWDAAEPSPEARFGASRLPGIVLGAPGDSSAVAGSTSVASLGFGGSAVVAFDDVVIEDGPGPDFIVFENAFFVGAAPGSAQDGYSIFAEPGLVDVSVDGVTWVRFPYDAQALADAAGANVTEADVAGLVGLAGITPTFTGNWTVPDDPLDFDPAGTGGVSGAGGDAFDLAVVGLTEARFVRVTDADGRNGPTGTAEGFDLDAVVVLHGRPSAPSTPDRDGDGLPDLAETRLYSSDPDLPDTDADGIDDGREVAACRDPRTGADDPVPPREPGLWLSDAAGCTELRWTFLGSGALYDVVRGDLGALSVSGSSVDLGATACLADDHPTVEWACDSGVPGPGEGWFYLVRISGAADYGRSGALEPRTDFGGCP